ncbi:hypothetical protein [Maribacter sp. 2210JD10-5]|uniref:hypothetical protein n=1 Tax=Maribacter sp. 2210JD10-5 TaxID=3386272 RepID=UPI0039BCF18E
MCAKSDSDCYRYGSKQKLKINSISSRTIMKTIPFSIKQLILLLFIGNILSVNAQKSMDRYPVLLNMVHHNPGEPHFETKFTQPEYIQALGYTGQVPKIEIQCGLTYDDWEDNVVPEGTAEKMWILRHAAEVRTRLAIAEKNKMPVYPFTDVLVVPKSIMDKYGDVMKVDGRLSIKSPKTQEILKAQITEIFKRFPSIDGLTIRHGETYLHDTPYHVGTSPAITPEEHSIMIALLREEICVKQDKKLFYRTWDFGKFHTNPEYYLKATDAVAPHEKLYFSIKHVNNDFLRGNPFNTTIGLGKHQQIVELSTNQAGIYGRNAHPYYIGKGIIEGWSEMESKKGLQDLYDNPKIKGFWTWTWGDGWVGPYFDNELWIKLNEYILRAYAKNPDHTEEELFFTYAKDELGLSKKNAQRLRELCLLSTDAVYYGQATKYARTIPWYIRDHYMTGIDLTRVVEDGLTEKILKEKELNLQHFYTMETLSKEIQLPRPKDQEFLEVSTTYGRIKYEIINEIWKIQLMLAQYAVNQKIDKEDAKAALTRYKIKWKEWRQLRKDHVSCPTLYVDYEAIHIPWFKPFQESVKELEDIILYQ